MKNSKELLSSVLKTTQMGQIGIHSLLKASLEPALDEALKSQLKEYDTIEQEAHRIASTRDWQLKELNPSIEFMTNLMTKMQLSFGNSVSRAAAMMVHGNTKGMVKGIKNLHHFKGYDPSVTELTQKLIDTEENNIKQMQRFL